MVLLRNGREGCSKQAKAVPNKPRWEGGEKDTKDHLGTAKQAKHLQVQGSLKAGECGRDRKKPEQRGAREGEGRKSCKGAALGLVCQLEGGTGVCRFPA